MLMLRDDNQDHVFTKKELELETIIEYVCLEWHLLRECVSYFSFCFFTLFLYVLLYLEYEINNNNNNNKTWDIQK